MEGLPIRRLSYSEKSGVVALTDELDAWLHHLRLPQKEGSRTSEALIELRHLRGEVQRSRCELHRNITKFRAQFKALVGRIHKTP